MRVLLEGYRLTKIHNLGGIDALWRNLTFQLLHLAPPENQFVILSAFLKRKHTATLHEFRTLGAELRHWWAAPQWLDRLGRFGMKAEWLAGTHDIVHIPEPVWHFRGKGRLVVNFNDVMYRLFPQYLEPEWVDRLERGTQDLVQRATYWLCISEHTRDQLIEHYGVPRGRTGVITLGVEDAFHGAGDDEDAVKTVRNKFKLLNKPYFLFLGSVEPKKNLSVLLDAFALALNKGLRAELAVAGRAGLRSELVRDKVAQSPQLKNNVKFLGFVDQEDLPYLLGGARTMVLPSRYEGFGIPVVESMAAGTPVFCSDRGAMPEVAGGAAKLFDPDDVEGLAELMLNIDADQQLWETLRAGGLQRARQFTWQQCALDTLEGYRRALELPE